MADCQAVGGAFQPTVAMLGRLPMRAVYAEVGTEEDSTNSGDNRRSRIGEAVPNAQVEYELVRPETKVDDPRLMELFRQLGRQQVNPFIGQAIAWHLTDDKSWSDLSYGGSNSRTISNYLTSSSDNECGFCPLTLDAASTWVNHYASLAP